VEYISELLDGSFVVYKYYKKIWNSINNETFENVINVINECINENPKDNRHFKELKSSLESADGNRYS